MTPTATVEQCTVVLEARSVCDDARLADLLHRLADHLDANHDGESASLREEARREARRLDRGVVEACR